MNLFYQPQITDGLNHLDESESRHLIRVLRKKQGDIIHLTNGAGVLYEAVIEDDNLKACAFRVKNITHSPARDYRIHIAISPLKNPERLEWFVEKCTEFIVDEITLIECERTEKHHVRLDRLEKIAVSAMKQSLNYRLPVVKGPIPFSKFIRNREESSRFIAYVDSSNQQELIRVASAKQSYVVLIGPEGDFTPAELEQCIGEQFLKVSLGPTRLRTETAGIAACHILNLVNT